MNEVDTWFFDHFWPAYLDFVKTPFAVPKFGAGARGECLKKVQQAKPSKELQRDMLDGILAQTRHRKKLYEKTGSKAAYNAHTIPLAKGGESVYKNRNGKTWIFNLGWNDNIPSLSVNDTGQNIGVAKCFCGQPVYGSRFTECEYHLSFDKNDRMTTPFTPELRAMHKKLKLDPKKGNEALEMAKQLLKQGV